MNLWDVVMAFIAHYSLVLYLLMFTIAWFVIPRTEVQTRHTVVVAGFAGLLAFTINFILAHIDPKGIFGYLPTSAFHSDFITASVAFACATLGRKDTWLSSTFAGVALAILLLRVYTSGHLSADVPASLVIGALSGLIIWKFARFLSPLTAVLGLVSIWFEIFFEMVFSRSFARH